MSKRLIMIISNVVILFQNEINSFPLMSSDKIVWCGNVTFLSFLRLQKCKLKVISKSYSYLSHIHHRLFQFMVFIITLLGCNLKSYTWKVIHQVYYNRHPKNYDQNSLYFLSWFSFKNDLSFMLKCYDSSYTSYLFGK